MSAFNPHVLRRFARKSIELSIALLRLLNGAEQHQGSSRRETSGRRHKAVRAEGLRKYKFVRLELSAPRWTSFSRQRPRCGRL